MTASDGSFDLSDTFTLTVTPVNDAPVAAPIADQSATEDTPWTFQVPAGTFSDVEAHALTYTATLSDGSALPSWLSFDAATGTFSGTPPLNATGTLELTVSASDGALDASDTFRLTITPVNDAPVVSAGIDNQSVVGRYPLDLPGSGECVHGCGQRQPDLLGDAGQRCCAADAGSPSTRQRAPSWARRR